jgi:formylglycine-generating enzyme required for sulfatase activity
MLIRFRHLVNNGVEETPPWPTSQSDESSQDLFVDLIGANVGFKHWHPVAVTANGNKLAGQAEMGGVWEWTSSPLAKHVGFEPMSLYPGYTGLSCFSHIQSYKDSLFFSRFLRRQTQCRTWRLLGHASPHCWKEILVSGFDLKLFFHTANDLS